MSILYTLNLYFNDLAHHAELQQKGFMIRPGTRVYNMCQDVIPIVAFKNEVKAAKQAALPPPPPKKWYQKLNPLSK